MVTSISLSPSYFIDLAARDDSPEGDNTDGEFDDSDMSRLQGVTSKNSFHYLFGRSNFKILPKMRKNVDFNPLLAFVYAQFNAFAARA